MARSVPTHEPIVLLIIATRRNERSRRACFFSVQFSSRQRMTVTFCEPFRISLITNCIVINQSRRALNVCVVKRGNWISGAFFLSLHRLLCYCSLHS